jgi:hypothetical protein
VGEAGGGVYEGDGRCNLIFRIFFLDFLSSNGIKQLYIDFKLKIWALAAVGTDRHDSSANSTVQPGRSVPLQTA